MRVPGDTDTEIYLEKPAPPADDEATASELREHFYGIDMGARDPFGNAIRDPDSPAAEGHPGDDGLTVASVKSVRTQL